MSTSTAAAARGRPARPAARHRTGAARRRRRAPARELDRLGERWACVPMTMPASGPRASRPRGGRAMLRIPLEQTTPVASSGAPSVRPAPRSPSRPRIVVVLLGEHLGQRAAWPPASTTASIARRATSVLPEPTSPAAAAAWPAATQIGEHPRRTPPPARRSARRATERRRPGGCPRSPRARTRGQHEGSRSAGHRELRRTPVEHQPVGAGLHVG